MVRRTRFLIGLWLGALLLGGCAAPIAPPVALVGIGAGSAHTCALDAEGAAWCWGSNQYGQLGTGDDENRSTRTLVSGGHLFTTLAGGGEHTCALDDDAFAWCWGRNLHGQLGNGTNDESNEPLAASALQFLALSAGFAHTCGLDLEGYAHCWGRNFEGQLGIGSYLDAYQPTLVSDTMKFTAITTGLSHTCALEESSGGNAWCWGSGAFGQLGDGLGTISSVPVAVSGGAFTTIAAGVAHTCGLGKNSGGLAWCWGHNDYGQLGVGDWDPRFTPAQALGGPYLAITAGGMHTCALGKNSGGRAWCWGYGMDGQIGDGIELSVNGPVAVDGSRIYTQISGGYDHTCALNDSGVWCWGENLFGQLGDGTQVARSVPVGLAAPQ
ncbi:MAG: hypothetical protein KF813_03175 [Trueperaceae bacterium]|nr:hypothetical protein [Trueperaceae bacterium]